MTDSDHAVSSQEAAVTAAEDTPTTFELQGLHVESLDETHTSRCFQMLQHGRAKIVLTDLTRDALDAVMQQVLLTRSKRWPTLTDLGVDLDAVARLVRTCRALGDRQPSLMHAALGAPCCDLAPVRRRAAAHGKLEMLQWLHARTPNDVWDEELFSAAANGRHLEVLHYIKLGFRVRGAA